MTVARVALAAGMLLLAFVGVAPPAEAGGFSLHLGGPHFSFGINRYPRYHYPYRYDHYRSPYAYRPYSYRYDRCDYWADRCEARWGGGRDYYGCMSYHGCW